jgi:hypothetical protein
MTMKKIIFCLSAALLFLAGCSTYYPENQGIATETGPNLTIDISNVKDSSFTATITPASDVNYFSYVITKADEAATLTASTLYGGGYKGVKNGTVKSDGSPYVINMTGLAPHTTYQVYAVGGNPHGFIGTVKNSQASTSDAYAPFIKSYKKTATSITLTYSENVKADIGVATIHYLAVADPTFEDAVKATDVTVSGTTAVINVPAKYPGAYFCITLGAMFVQDMKGNSSEAYKTYGWKLDATTGEPVGVKGIYGRCAVADFAFDDLPTEVTYFGNMETITLSHKTDLMFVDSESKTPVTFEVNGGKSVTTYTMVSGDDYAVSGDNKSVSFNVPAMPEFGKTCKLIIPEGAFYNKFGCSNAASDATYFRSYGYKLDDVFGVYSVSAKSQWSGDITVKGWTIAPYYHKEGDTTYDKDTVLVYNMVPGATETYGTLATFNTVSGEFTMLAWMFTDLYVNSKGVTCYVTEFNYNNQKSDYIHFTVPEAGKIVLNSDEAFGLYLYNASTNKGVGWYDLYWTMTLNRTSALPKSVPSSPSRSNASTRTISPMTSISR